MEAPSIDTVYQAISALYETNPNAKNDKEKASTWLGDVQKSVSKAFYPYIYLESYINHLYNSVILITHTYSNQKLP